MKNTKIEEYDLLFFENLTPTKLTESRRIKLNSKGWGLLTSYYLESVKINRFTPDEVSSAATMKVSDRSGQITCVVKGPSIGLLFGLSAQQWTDIEQLCQYRQQLFYRYFKNGLTSDFGYEQTLFYNFCVSNQKTEVLVAIFRRCVNKRNKDKSDAFLDILELRKCDISLLDIYVNHLRKNDN